MTQNVDNPTGRNFAASSIEMNQLKGQQALQDVAKAGGDLSKLSADKLYDALHYTRFNTDVELKGYARPTVTDTAKLAEMIQNGKTLSPVEKGMMEESLIKGLESRTSELSWLKPANAFKATPISEQELKALKAELNGMKAEAALAQSGVAAEGAAEVALASRLSNIMKGAGRLAGQAGLLYLTAEFTNALHDTIVSNQSQANQLGNMMAHKYADANPHRFNNLPGQEAAPGVEP